MSVLSTEELANRLDDVFRPNRVLLEQVVQRVVGAARIHRGAALGAGERQPIGGMKPDLQRLAAERREQRTIEPFVALEHQYALAHDREVGCRHEAVVARSDDDDVGVSHSFFP